MAGRLGDDEKARVFTAVIEDLMRRLREHGETGGWREPMFFTIELDDEHSSEHVEELCCSLMQMPLFGGARRHALFDDSEAFRTMEVPAVAGAGLCADGAGPGVVLGGGNADGFHVVSEIHGAESMVQDLVAR